MADTNSLLSKEKLSELKDNKALRFVGRMMQIAFVVGVFVFLINKLSAIGWQDVWQALPTSPLYYILFLAWFFSIPIAELFVYRLMWGLSLGKDFAVFVRKRVYNLAILSYSGEAYLAYWANRNLPLRGRVIMKTVKDSNILSGLASNVITVVFLLIFMGSGQLEKMIEADPNFKFYFGFAAAIGLILVPLVLRFRNKILSLPGTLVRDVFAIHVARNFAMLVFQTGMWAVVLPEVPALTWTLFITAQLVLTRIPFLPNTDLIYLGLGLSLSGYLDAPEATVAGMFVAAGALSQLLNFLAFLGTSFGSFKPADGPATLPEEDILPLDGDLFAETAKTLQEQTDTATTTK